MPMQMSMPLMVVIIVVSIVAVGILNAREVRSDAEKSMDTSCSSKSASQSARQSRSRGGPTLARITKPKPKPI